jgi:hypothetical protein
MISLSLGEVLRSLFFLVFYTLLPGFFITSIIWHNRKLLTSGAIGWWIGWSLAVNAMVAQVVAFLQGSLDNYLITLIAINAIGVASISVRALKGQLQLPSLCSRDRLYLLLVLLISLFWFGAILRSGPRIDYEWDQWFHIAHVREAVESNLVRPNNPFWPDMPLSEIYGLWHSLLAAVARSAGLSVLVLWRVGNAYLAALGFWVIYAVAGTFFSEGRVRFIAAIVFLGSGFGALQITRTFVYPWGITNLLLWISLGIFFQYFLDGDWRKLLSATAIGVTAATIHPQEFIFLCFGIFALGVSGILMKREYRGISLELKRVWSFLVLLMLLGMLVLLLQYPGTISAVLTTRAASETSTDLPLYEHPLARLLSWAFPYFWKFGLLKHTFLPFNFISLLILFLLPHYLDSKVRWFLVTLTWAPTLAVLFPGLSWLTGLVLKETYSWRLLNLVPTPFVWAPIIGEGISVMITGRVSQDGETAFSGPLGRLLLILIVVLIGAVMLYASVAVRRNEFTLAGVSPIHEQTMFVFLDDLSPERATVLSDPETSYAIPGLTKHYVVLNEPSHGSRDDINQRFIETRELLASPYQTNDDALATLERYGVDFIVINKLWLERVFFLQTPFYSEYTLDFLNSNPLCFELVYDDVAFSVFEFLGCTSGEIVGKGVPRPAALSVANIQTIVQEEFSKDLTLVGYSLIDSDEILPGDTLRGELYWQISDDVSEPYAVWVGLLCDYQERSLPYGKLGRRVRESVTGEVFQVGSTLWMPTSPQGFSTREIYVQNFVLEIPENLTQNPCDLHLHVLDRRQTLRDQRALPYWFMEMEYTLPSLKLHSFE